MRSSRCVDVGVYDYKARQAAGPTKRQVADAEIVALMRETHAASDGDYGVPRMWRELRRAGIVINIKRVHRLMRAHGLAGRFRPRTVRTTFPGPDGYVIADLVGRRFAPGAPNAAWCQDITYIATGEGWLFLAGVVDLDSRRLLGYSMAEHMRTTLVTDALTMATAARGGTVDGVIAHADRGSPVNTRRMTTSTSASNISCDPPSDGPGCWDNAVVESFWESLKRECIQGRVFATRAEARRAIFRWINWYNTSRLHASLDHIPPSGNTSTVKRHIHPSGQRGDAHLLSACESSATRSVKD